MSAAVGLRRVERVEVHVRRELRERLSAGCRAFQGKDFEAFLAEDVLERMLTIGKTQAPNEWMGLLLGYVGRDDRGDYVVVRAVIHDHEALARPGFIESTHASEARTRLLGRLLFPDLVVLGWSHGHVKCGAFFSGEDYKTQATWTAPYALGVVVDPWDPKELAVFRGPDGERLDSFVRPALPAPSGPKIASVPPTAKPRASGRPGLRRIARAAGVVVAVLAALTLLASAVAFGVDLRLRVRALERRVE